MRKSAFSEKEILEILHQAETPLSPRELCKQYGVSVQTFYRWRRKYGSKLKRSTQRLSELEDENSRLKKLVIEKELKIHRLEAQLDGKSRGH